MSINKKDTKRQYMLDKTSITLIFEDKVHAVSWYSDTSIDDVRFAILCACDSLVEGEFEVMDDSAKKVDFNISTNFRNNSNFFIRKISQKPSNILLDSRRKLYIEIEALRHIEVQTSIKNMLLGANLLKHKSNSFPHLRLFQISTDLKRLIWYTKSKKLDEAQVQINSIVEITFGQDTKNFRRYPLKLLENYSFSLHYYKNDDINNRAILDLTCKDEREYDLWVLGIKALCAHNLGKFICKDTLLSHSRCYIEQVKNGNIAKCTSYLFYNKNSNINNNKSKGNNNYNVENLDDENNNNNNKYTIRKSLLNSNNEFNNKNNSDLNKEDFHSNNNKIPIDEFEEIDISNKNKKDKKNKIKQINSLDEYVNSNSRNLNKRQIGNLALLMCEKLKNLRNEMEFFSQNDQYNVGEVVENYDLIFSEEAIADDLDSQKCQMLNLYKNSQIKLTELIDIFLDLNKKLIFKNQENLKGKTDEEILENFDYNEFSNRNVNDLNYENVDEFQKILQKLQISKETFLDKYIDCGNLNEFDDNNKNLKFEFDLNLLNDEKRLLKEFDLKLWKIEIDYENILDILNRFNSSKDKGFLDKIKDVFKNFFK